jgi:pimeloyl-ACP methyl ester carboxylesterase
MAVRGPARYSHRAMSNPQYLELEGERIAFRKRSGRAPTIVWLGGFKSVMDATKGSALDVWAERTVHSLLRFDYFGHGLSSGEFRNGTVTRWRDNALAMIDRETTGPLVLVGSSMGGFLSLLVSQLRRERIAGMVLIAPATDFTEELFWKKFSADVQQQIMEQGEYLWPSIYDDEPYAITRGLIEDGRKDLLFPCGKLAMNWPVRILQGMQDPDVPWQHAVRLVDMIDGDVRLTLVKDGDHRLARPGDLALLARTIEDLIAEIGAK